MVIFESNIIKQVKACHLLTSYLLNIWMCFVDVGFNCNCFWFIFYHSMSTRMEMAILVQPNCATSWLTLARSWRMRKLMRWFERPTLMVMGRWIMKVSWLSLAHTDSDLFSYSEHQLLDRSLHFCFSSYYLDGFLCTCAHMLRQACSGKWHSICNK